MSGHSKWSTIKRAKAKNDAANAKVFTKLGREIMVAVKEGGGPDPNMNTRLKNIITKAKAANMPNDNINRSIKRGSGESDAVNFEAITYEGYGPAGSAVIVYALTDNKNRTAGEVRHYFDKFGGSLGSTNCVSYLFSKKGLLLLSKGNGLSEDDVMMHALESGADDTVTYDTHYEIFTTPENFDSVKEYFDNNNIELESAEVTLIPSNYVEMPADKSATFQKLLNALEDNDDIQEVYHNVEYDEEGEF